MVIDEKSMLDIKASLYSRVLTSPAEVIVNTMVSMYLEGQSDRTFLKVKTEDELNKRIIGLIDMHKAIKKQKAGGEVK